MSKGSWINENASNISSLLLLATDTLFIYTIDTQSIIRINGPMVDKRMHPRPGCWLRIVSSFILLPCFSFFRSTNDKDGSTGGTQLKHPNPFTDYHTYDHAPTYITFT